MNSTNLLLGSTGFLLVVALLFSFTKMNEGKNQNPNEIEALTLELARLEAEKELLEKQSRQPSSGSLIFTTPYQPSAPLEVPEKKDENEAALAEMKDQIEILAANQTTLRTEVADVNRPAPEPLLPDLLDEPVEEVVEEPVVEDPHLARRGRIIESAILQATIQAWDPEEWIVVIDPSARANFNVGDKLALRRNNGILCTFLIERQVGPQYIGTLMSNLASGAPEVVPGDELIIPPPFKRPTE